MDDPTKVAAPVQKRPVKVFRTGHYTEVVPFRMQRLHGISSWHLTYTLRGGGQYQQPGVSFNTQPGDLVLVEPGGLIDYRCVPEVTWEFIWMQFMARPHWVKLFAWPAAGKKIYRLSIENPNMRQRIRDVLLRSHKEACIGTDALSREFALHTLEEAILLAARENTAAPRQQLSAPVARVLDHMVEKIGDRHTLNSLAKVAHISPSHLAYCFKQETGDAVIAYLLKLRLRQAAQMLENSERRVNEVAKAVGFNDPLYFTRQFRRFYLMSPRQYREKSARQSRGLI